MKCILRTVAKDNDIVMEKLEVILDHVHVLISFPPSKAPTSAIKALKGRSAFIFLKRHPEIWQSQYWGGHLWSPSYYMSTLGNMSKDVVENYINNQKYNALQKKKRPNGRWVSLSIPWLKSRDFRLGIIKSLIVMTGGGKGVVYCNLADWQWGIHQLILRGVDFTQIEIGFKRHLGRRFEECR